MPRVVIAPDKFRGTADAGAVAAAMGRAAASLGWDATILPMSDGGEGMLDACVGVCPERMTTEVAGPDGILVLAEWRLGPGMAVVEMARASGLSLAGGPTANDPMAASTQGTGELLVAAARAVGPGGTVVLGMGGSATTDGGRGALEAIARAGGLGGAALVGAYDVDVAFVDAARLFGPQKGATPEQVTLLRLRLEQLAASWVEQSGVDVREVPGSGAAGGMGGAVVILGGSLRSGYEMVAGLVGTEQAMHGADRVVTGEGALDATSFAGKVVGGVVGDARGLGLDVLVVAGRSTPEGAAAAGAAGCDVVSLVDRFGADRAMGDTLACIEEATGGWLARPGR